MNYGELKTQWENRLGVTDSNDDHLPGLINSALSDISNGLFLEFYKKSSQIATIAPITTGTVSITNGSASITFSSAPSATAVGQLIKFGDDDEYYRFSAHTAGATAATLAAEYVGTTDTVATYTLYTWQYALPSDYQRGGMKQVICVDPHQVIELRSEDTFREDVPNLAQRSSAPEVGFEIGDAVIQLWPLPDAAYVVDLTYYRTPTLISLSAPDSADTIDIPAQYHEAVLHFCLMNHSANIRDSVVSHWMRMYEQDKRTIRTRHGVRMSRRLRNRRWNPRFNRYRGPRINV